MKNEKNIMIIAAVVVILVGVGAFFGGMKYGQSTSSSGRPDGGQGFARMGGAGGRGGFGAGANGGMVNGDVLSKDDKSLTVKLRDGGSKIVFYTASTTVREMTDGAIGDVAVGKTVTVVGTTNSDGSVTAQQIQLRPADAAGLPPGAIQPPKGAGQMPVQP